MNVLLIAVAFSSLSAVSQLGPSGPRAPSPNPITLASALPAASKTVAGSTCQPDWLPTFGPGGGLDGFVFALTVFDDGTGAGPQLHAGGQFSQHNRIAKWNGASWSTLGSGVGERVFCLAVFDDGNGPALYAGGMFLYADGASARRIAKWDGASWSPLGTGMSGVVHALAVYDDGDGPALYAGGEFFSAGDVPADHVAKWDGASWSPLGSGTSGHVHGLAVFDDGGGPALYAGGTFTSAGGVNANRIAKWDGASWSALGSGTNPGSVRALAVHDDGTGPALYAGGAFTNAGGVGANGIARWDGTAWSGLGSGVNTTVRALAVYDDGRGPALFAGGDFVLAGGLPASKIARWDGASWSALGAGADETVAALTVHDAGNGPDLFVGGRFSVSPAGDKYVARWGGCADSSIGTSYCFGDGSATPCPCGNSGGPGQGCANSTGVGAVLAASGSTSVSLDSLVMVAWSLPPDRAVLLFSGAEAVNNGNGVAFGDGLRCAGGAVQRLGIQIADSSGSTSWGPGLCASAGWSPGDTRRLQAWNRDPTGSPCGSGFNLSNGCELSFTD